MKEIIVWVNVVIYTVMSDLSENETTLGERVEAQISLEKKQWDRDVTRSNTRPDKEVREGDFQAQGVTDMRPMMESDQTSPAMPQLVTECCWTHSFISLLIFHHFSTTIMALRLLSLRPLLMPLSECHIATQVLIYMQILSGFLLRALQRVPPCFQMDSQIFALVLWTPDRLVCLVSFPPLW